VADITTTRKDLREVEGVRLTYVCPAIPAGSSIVIDFEGTRLYKYKPFDVVSVYNNSSYQVTVKINQDDDFTYPVAAKSEREIDKIWCHTLSITNNGSGNVASGEIVLMCERKGIDADEMAKRQARGWRLWWS